MRASRLLSLLLLLQTRGRMSAQALADELEVSIRTVYRDIESLSAAGVPVYADRGPAGGYQLIGGYRTRLTGLTGDEADALFLAGLPAAAADLGLGAMLASAELKLLAALPPDLRARAARIRERFYVDAPGWFQEVGQTPYLGAVADAVWNQRALRVRYRRAGRAGERSRTLEPLGVVLKAGAWYLMARARSDALEAGGSVSAAPPLANIRTYRISRILDLETLDDHFERPEGFDLAAQWAEWSQAFEARMYSGEATVRLSSRAMELAPYYLDAAVYCALMRTASAPDEEGWVRADVPIESLEHATGLWLRFGAEVEALAPPELRARIVAAVHGMAERYAVAGARTGARSVRARASADTAKSASSGAMAK